jgi:hypothetical protein
MKLVTFGEGAGRVGVLDGEEISGSQDRRRVRVRRLRVCGVAA